MRTSTYISEITLTDFIEETTRQYLKSLNGESRKHNGQYFTPASIAKFMAEMAKYSSESINLLDPGAGTGILTAAICDQIIKYKKCNYLKIDLYENDKKVIPFLQKNIGVIEDKLNKNGIKTDINIISEDFIIHNAHLIEDTLFLKESFHQYDIIISNPPYLKVSKESKSSQLMSNIVHGQPNIYMFFMAISAVLLKQYGQLIFITPRSYCSGLYFKRFRQWFLNEIKPVHFHSFESRKETFKNEVLQETIIIKGVKQINNPLRTKITISQNSDLSNSCVVNTKYEQIIFPQDQDKIIHIPGSKRDLEIIKLVKSWKKSFTDLGFKLSTGPVVSFRATHYTEHSSNFDGYTSAPLIWMNHLKNFQIQYPIKNTSKPQVIKISSNSVRLLLKNKNYVLVKRFSSKEQKRRISAYYYSSTRFDTTYIGFENHLNYIWKPLGELTEIEALGITSILNSSLIDRYFRIINGNTQVNASEINSLPFPDYNTIINIGRKIMHEKWITFSHIDSIVYSELSINDELKEKIDFE